MSKYCEHCDSAYLGPACGCAKSRAIAADAAAKYADSRALADERELIAELNDAKSRADAELADPPLDGNNPHFNSRYATLSACLKSVRAVYGKHGLNIGWKYSADGKWIECRVSYKWVWISSGPVPNWAAAGSKGNPAHAFGSSATFGKRYSLCTVVPIVGDADDDGNAAPDEGQSAANAAQQSPGAAAVAGGKKLSAKKMAQLRTAAIDAHEQFKSEWILREFVRNHFGGVDLEYLTAKQVDAICKRFADPGRDIAKTELEIQTILESKGVQE